MTELGEKIFSLCAQGRTTKEIVDLCGVSGTTARKYRRRYREKHPGGALTLRNILPKATQKGYRAVATGGYSAGDCADSQRNQSGRQNPAPEP